MQDRQFFLLAISLENATQIQLNRLTVEIKTIVGKYTKGGMITDQQAVNQAIKKVINNFYDVFVENLYVSSEKVGALKATEAIEDIIPLLTKAGLYKEAIVLYKQVQNYAQDVAKRLFVNKWAGEPLGFRIKTIIDGTQKTVLNIIANGMSESKGAKDIAKDIIQYVNPVQDITKIQPYEEYRQRFGRPKSFTPKGIPAGTLQYNALRIARTETAHIYRQATTDFYEDKEYTTGYTWHLSNRHPAPDECDDFADQKYKTAEDLPIPHPNCLCDVRPIVMSAVELRQLRSRQNIDETLMERAIRTSRELVPA